MCVLLCLWLSVCRGLMLLFVFRVFVYLFCDVSVLFVFTLIFRALLVFNVHIVTVSYCISTGSPFTLCPQDRANM